jgi:hypothetical protein
MRLLKNELKEIKAQKTKHEREKKIRTSGDNGN